MDKGIAGNQPSATYTAFELIPIQSVCPIHDELEIVQFSPLSLADSLVRFAGIHFIKTRLDFLLFGAVEIYLPAFVGIWCFSLVFILCFFPLAKGECSEADVNIAVSY